jgi:hypothetical protein
MKKPQTKLTYANVVATFCLFLLIGGDTAFAATELSANSVSAVWLKRVGPAGPSGPLRESALG